MYRMTGDLVALFKIYALQYVIAFIQILDHVKTFLIFNYITQYFHLTFEVGYFV